MKKLTLLIAVAALGILVYKQMTKESAPAEQASAQGLPSYSPQGAIEDEIINGDTTLLELPRLAGGNNNYFVTHRASGKVNYSLEYDVTKLHSRWVAFSFDAATAETTYAAVTHGAGTLRSPQRMIHPTSSAEVATAADIW